MADHKLSLGDDAPSDEEFVSAPVLRRPYRVINELFKNGKTIKAGGTVDLDVRTAAAFLEVGDIEEIEEKA